MTHGSAAIGLTMTAAVTVSTVVSSAISVSGTAKRIVRASASMSAVVREIRSPLPARSTVESGSAEHARHELLAQAGEDLLGEHERGTPREPGQHGLRDDEARQERSELVDVRGRRAVDDVLDEPAEQRRAGEPRNRGEGVQHDHRGERARLRAREQARVRRAPRGQTAIGQALAHGTSRTMSGDGCGEPGGSPRSPGEGGTWGKHAFPHDREPEASGAHSASPRVTVSR